jgi:ADP-sugar diphosphatase
MEIQNKFKILNPNKINEDTLSCILNSKKFQDYVNNIDTNSVDVESISILHVYMFGKNVGFVDLLVDCNLKSEKKKLPGYVFIRGNSVAIMIIVNDKYLLLTKQFRTPAGSFMIEAPAGMMDESGNIVGTAAKEIQEETGITINLKDLISLGSIYPSPGGCDEKIELFYCKLKLDDKDIEEMLNKTFGDQSEHEQIKLVLNEFNKENIINTQDAKLICAALAYEKVNNTIIQ